VLSKERGGGSIALLRAVLKRNREIPLTLTEEKSPQEVLCGVMQANVFRRSGEFGLEEKPIPTAGPGEAVIQIRLTTICGTDIHNVRGEYQVPLGLTLRT
jgi:hypothetical protein